MVMYLTMLMCLVLAELRCCCTYNIQEITPICSIHDHPVADYTGGAGEGGGFLKCAATSTASISQVF